MSGRIVCNFAAKYPKQATAIVSLCATMWGASPEAAKQTYRTIEELPKRGMQVVIETDQAYVKAKLKGEALEATKRQTLANDPAAYALASKPVAEDFEGKVRLDFLDKITCPKMVIVGDSDSVPLLGAVEMFHRLQGSRLGVIPDCGHFAMQERPEVLLAMLNDFLSEVFKRVKIVRDFFRLFLATACYGWATGFFRPLWTRRRPDYSTL